MSKTIKPQPGFQVDFLSSSADIVIGGGAAGVGKTFVELLEPMYHKDIPGFNAVFFRRTSVQIRNPGGLWDKSFDVYTSFKGKSRQQQLDWVFPSGAVVKFSHLEYESNVYDHQGTEYCLIIFDELTHFTKKQFFYMLSRNRSMCGVKPYIRATCNPDPDSFVAELVDWYIDEETGYPIDERCGRLRFFVVHNDEMVWGDSKKEVLNKIEFLGLNEDHVKSFTFIPGKLEDNKKLMSIDPGYVANLMALPDEEKRRLKDGNWKKSTESNQIYNYDAFNGMFNNLYDLDKKDKYITADIAMKGSDLFVVGYWEGFNLVECYTEAVSDGNSIIELIRKIAREHNVENRNICYDADGVGSFIDGFIKGATAFNGGIPALPVKDLTNNTVIKENYANLKTQCYYRSANRVNAGGYRVLCNIATQLKNERKAIKRAKPDNDGKLSIISKAEMKVILKGKSPDYMDMFMMREIFELKIKKQWVSL